LIILLLYQAISYKIVFLEEGLKNWKFHLPDVVAQINGFNKRSFRSSNEILASFFNEHQNVVNIPQSNSPLYKYQQGTFFRTLKKMNSTFFLNGMSCAVSDI